MAQTPHTLINAMMARAGELTNVEICHVHTEGPLINIAHPDHQEELERQAYARFGTA